MQWLNDVFSGDKGFGWIAILAVGGIAALVALAIVYRLVFAHRLKVPGGRTRQPRLGLVDAFSLDGQRQLVLIRRDNIEHLVMIGGPNDVLVESQISRALAPGRETSLAPGPAQPAPSERRRAEPAVVPPPAPVQPASAQTAPVQPASAPPSTVPAAEVPLVRVQAVPPSPRAPAAAAPPAPPAAARAVQPAPLRAAAKLVESPRPIPAVQPQPRPLPPRASMPPPIAPPSPPAGRSNVVRPIEAPPQAAALHAADAGSASRPGARQPAKPPPQAAASKAPDVAAAPAEASAKPEPDVGPPAPGTAPGAPAQAAKPESYAAQPAPEKTPVSPAPIHPIPNAKPEPKVDQAAAPVPAPVAPKHGVADETPPCDKAAHEADDPYAGLDSLEAEMARLLGRETQN